MKTFVIIAWRNMLRNPRRSGLVVAAIAVGLWGMLFSLGFMNGMGRQMVDNALDSHLAHIQVHHRDYQAVIEGFNFFRYQVKYYIDDPDVVMRAVEGADHVVATSPRVLATGLATNAQNARAIIMVGIDPERESKVTRISSYLKEGSYVSSTDGRDIFIGKALADKLGIEVGSKIVLMAQDINRDKAMAAFKVVGIYESSLKMHDEAYVYIGIEAARRMLGMGDKIHEVAALVDDPKERLDAAKASIASRLDLNKYTPLTWKEIWPMLVRLLGMFDTFTYIFFILVFIAMAFGIANAVLMTVFERIREFGIMKALGTRPSQIFLVVALESACLGAVGIALGTFLGWLTVFYFGAHGMDLSVFSAVLDQMGLGSVVYTSMKTSYVFIGALMALVTALLSAMWPAAKAAKLKPVDAIRHV